MQTLDKAGVRLKLEKCKIAETRTEWLGCTPSQNGVNPIDEKVQAISDRLRSTTLIEQQSLTGP